MKKTVRRILVLLAAAGLAMALIKGRQLYGAPKEAEVSGAAMQTLPELVKEKARQYRITETPEEVELPVRFDYREEGRTVPVRDQGKYNTCWAFASLTALETSLMPEEALDFSRDHLSYQNSYMLQPEDGGSYVMSAAYLAGWQGPVLEADDPYGDRESFEGLVPVKHVQEIRMPDYRDFEGIKKTVYLHGGVETSLYMDFDNPREESAYYRRETAAYCYEGDLQPNHDVVIIGWDDRYPAENFKAEVSQDGAFICQNSWGTEFGEDGIFYVSYEDAHIGSYNVAYTKIENTDNYDEIYQSDLCGWTGQIGYNSETGYMANVYTGTGEQELQAVGFYAVGSNTKYRLAVVEDFDSPEHLENLEYIQSGYMPYAGYYTIELEEPVTIREGRKFALVVKIMTPEASYPIAVEFRDGDITKAVVLEDGEGYISPDGENWEPLEEMEDCNLCLKAYAVRR